MQEIKDCPICKCKAVLRHERGGSMPYRVECATHPLSHSLAFSVSKADAIDRWNKWVGKHPLQEPTQSTIRREILDEAAKCVCGGREAQYGSPEDNFKLIADLWEDYLQQEITPVDVAMMMAMFKIARIKTGTMTRDSFIDACGYIACGGEIAARTDFQTL